ncbi:MAG: hypothetical protein GY811_04830 [Myxococcales bacterium]|nr:hypothetical protein [Myxococcales bacterium]
MKFTDKSLLRLRVTGCPEETDEESCDQHGLLDEFEEDYCDSYESDCLGLGTWVGPIHHIFEVIIHYRDPQNGSLAEPRSWSLEVSASSREEARRTATKDFRLVESLTSGPWQREIFAVEVIDDELAGLSGPESSSTLS